MSFSDLLKKLFGGHPGGKDAARFVTVESEMTTYTQTTDQVIVTAINDEFMVRWDEQDDAGGLRAKTAARTVKLGYSPQARGKKAEINLIGFQQYRAEPPARMTIRIDGRAHDADLRQADSPITFRKSTRLARDPAVLEIQVEIVVPRPALPGLHPEVKVESLDVKLHP